MSEWLEEIENLERICEETKKCSECKLGYCIKLSGEIEDNTR